MPKRRKNIITTLEHYGCKNHFRHNSKPAIIIATQQQITFSNWLEIE